MANPSKYLDELIREFSKLPGIGAKSASRLAFHILGMTIEDTDKLINSIVSLKENICTCAVCGGISDEERCSVCRDESRDRGLICVVENARDILTIESTGKYSGTYHVLMGLISPLDGIGPDELNISPLIKRCGNNDVREVIIALNSTVEGDATTLYLAKLLANPGIKVTGIARGLPAGADLEFADSATIIKSIEGRVEL